MHFRTSRLRASVLLLALTTFLLPSGHAPAQQRERIGIPAEALTSETVVQRLLKVGRRLESERRWGEALSHYEDAARSYPGRKDLAERLTLAKIHFDLGRRYADRGFTRAIGQMSYREALDLYAEVLLKVQTHFVNEPDWRQLVRRGSLALQIALSDAEFTRRHLPGASSERIDQFRQELERSVDWRAVQTRDDARNLANMAARLAQHRLGLSQAALLMEYTCGAAGALDNYSTYLTATQLEDVYSQIEGNFVGLGIELKTEQGALLVVSVIPDSPALRGGLRAGDRIVQVDGQSTEDLSTDRAADLLKGKPLSTVQVTVVSSDGASRSLRLRRERVEVPSVEDIKIIDPLQGVGYLRLSSFQKTTSRDLDAALWRLHREGMRSLIIDLRGNPGGLLSASVEIADKFITEGTIVSTRGRSPREDYDYKAHRVGTWRVPLVVLIDRNTASASEILAGAILDHRRGHVVGQRSYGKGSVQGIFPLSLSSAGMRLTTAKFYSPSGQAISHRGIDPDLPVRTVAKPIDGPRAGTQQDDPVLKLGVETARRQISRR